MSRLLATLLILCVCACTGGNAADGPLVLGASSLQEALEESADRWAEQGHLRPRLSIAGTPALARQIEAGAPADIFIAADAQWMNEMARKEHIQVGTRVVLAGNRLVLVAANDNPVELAITPGFPLAATLGPEKLALADPSAVPAGRYARQALGNLGVWHELDGRIAPTDSVRSALALVARSEAPLGIVYASDAAAEPDVRVVGTFPDSSHLPIRYPAALLQTSEHPDASAFLAFLHSPEGQTIFARHGFRSPEAP